MASGKTFRQLYFGRVISPAKYWGDGEKPYITFDLYVDRLLVNANKERISGKIGCSYSVQGDNDPVALILCRVEDKENPETGGLAGESYKSVEVIVEGTERLTVVTNGEGEVVSRAVYKNLDYCSVQVTDNGVLDLFRKHTNAGNKRKDSEQRPTKAPVSTKTSKRQVQQEVVTKDEQQDEEEPTTYKVGDRLINKGVEYEFIGGNSMDRDNWKPVKPKKTKVKTSPFDDDGETPTTHVKKAEQAFKDLLENDDVEDEEPVI